MKHILIASSKFDRFTTTPVKKILLKKGYKVTVFEADKVAQAQDRFTISITETGNPVITYKDRKIHPLEIAAAWYRRPNIFFDNYEDSAKEESLAIQYRGIQKYLWDTIPQQIWLNSYVSMNNAGNKLNQLAIAQKLGFRIPDTIVSNNWDQIIRLPGDKIVMKMIDGQLNTKSDKKFFFTKIFPKNKDSLPIDTLPYPGIWQSFLEKKREWRITIVGSHVFPVAIYTHTKAKDDWRLHQFTKDYVKFKEEAFPDALQKKCLQFLKHYNLHFGVFDFIETPEGEIVFLELNPNGQYGWLEDELKLPISEAIAAELENIANNK